MSVHDFYRHACRTTTLWTPESTNSVTSLAEGNWDVWTNSVLTLNVTNCGGNTVYTCLDSNQDVSYTLSSKGNSLVVLGSEDGDSQLVYAYEARV